MVSKGISLSLAARRLDALNLRDAKHLARHLSIEVDALKELAKNAGGYVQPFSKMVGKKMRGLHRTREPLNGVLARLNRLLQRLKLPKALHGSVRGRSCLTNARPHVNAQAWLQLDIKDFFPLITPQQVYRMFVEDCGCSPDVAGLLTQLTTTEGHLPQGFPTSPAVANLVARPLARRLAKLALQHGATFTQYLDDMTISGPEHVHRLKNTALKIIRQAGFSISPNKVKATRKGQECIVTGVRVDGGLDAPTALKESLNSNILALEKSASGITSQELASLSGLAAHAWRDEYLASVFIPVLLRYRKKAEKRNVFRPHFGGIMTLHEQNHEIFISPAHATRLNPRFGKKSKRRVQRLAARARPRAGEAQLPGFHFSQ